ncbi:MAG: tryptophan-rich sensory protein [Candidatus Levyibacteriota bacterium]|nr:MAG: tryptophan-rich sensory protein [Candidatus Levybacteria bacterium]
MKLPKSILKLIFSIAICQSAGLIGTVFTVSSIENWYNLLNQPSFRPPNWLFGPVWTTLYTLMGISLYWIWIKGTKKKEVREALKLFAVHLVFNASWSIVFFGMNNIPLSLVNIIVLWILIIMVMVKFYKIDKKASWILLPYLAWVSFATILNFSIFLLNR